MWHTLFTWLTSTHFPKLILYRKPAKYSVIMTTVLLKAPKTKYLSQYQIYHVKLKAIVLYFYFHTFLTCKCYYFLSLYFYSIVNGSYIINHWFVGLNRKSYSHRHLFPPPDLLETKLDRISVYHKGKENNFKSACTFWEPQTTCEFCIILSLIPIYLFKN